MATKVPMVTKVSMATKNPMVIKVSMATKRYHHEKYMHYCSYLVGVVFSTFAYFVIKWSLIS